MKVMKTAGHSSAGCRGWEQSGVRAAASACLRLQLHRRPSAPGAQRGTPRCGPGSAPCGLSVKQTFFTRALSLSNRESRAIRRNKSQFTSFSQGFCTLICVVR